MGMYAELGRMYEKGLDFSRVTVFMLDEYIGIARGNPCSFAGYLDKHFYAKVNVPRARRHGFDSLVADPEAECRRYDRDIAEAGGFDLAILGIGRNGHVAFNEPGGFISLASHAQKLAKDTISRNRAGPTVEFPTHAMTVGMGAILNARSLLLLATGAAKARAIAEMMNGRVTTRLPASLLQIHDNCQVLADPAAARELGCAAGGTQHSGDHHR